MINVHSRRLLNQLFLALFSLGLPLSNFAQELVTGPPEGIDLTPVMCYAPVGLMVGQEFDASRMIKKAGNGGFLFIHELSRNIVPVVRTFDLLAGRYGLLGFEGIIILLSNDRTTAENRLKAINGSLKLRRPIVLSLDGVEGPGNYALNRKCVLSLVVIKSGKIHRSIAFVDTGEHNVAQVQELIAEVVGPEPGSEAEMRELANEQFPKEDQKLRQTATQQAMDLHWLQRKVGQMQTPTRRRNRQQGIVVPPSDMISGPPIGVALTPIMAYALNGPYTGQEFDVVSEIGQSPSMILFVHDLVRNAYPVIQAVDRVAAENALFGFKSFTLFLADDRTKAEYQLSRRNGNATGNMRFSVIGKYGALHLENPMVLSLDGAEGPGNYALNRKATLTLIFVRDGKVHRSVAITDTGFQDIPWIEKIATTLLDPLPEKEENLLLFVHSRLPTNQTTMREMVVRHIAFGHLFNNRQANIRIADLISQMTGNLPTEDEALRQIIMEGMPTSADELRQQAVFQAGELYRIYTKQLPKMQQQADAKRMNGGQMAAMRTSNQLMTDGKQVVKRTPTQPEDEKTSATLTTRKQGKPPVDPRLKKLFRSFIRQTNNQEKTDHLLIEIRNRSRQSDQLRIEVIQMLQLMLSISDRYGTPYAQKQARTFLRKEVDAEE